MNCLDFRRRLLVDPLSGESELLEHASSCGECAREAERMTRFEEALRRAVNVRPPEGLEARILLAQSFDDRRRPLGVRSRWLTMAAALLMAVGVAGWLGYRWDVYFGEPPGLGRVVLNHVNDELHYLHADQDVQRARLGQLFAHFGARLRGDIGYVSYATRCHIRRHAGVHLVLPGQEGPVTVLFMPDEHRSGPEHIRSERFTGMIVPTDYGSMAVLGEKGELLSEAIEKVRRSVVWET